MFRKGKRIRILNSIKNKGEKKILTQIVIIVLFGIWTFRIYITRKR